MSKWKGLLAVLCIFLALFILFALFGNDPANYMTEASPAVVPPKTDSAQYLRSGTYTSTYQAPAEADLTDTVSHEGVGYGGQMAKVQFGEEIKAGSVPADRKIIKEGSAFIETKDFDRSLSVLDQMIAQSGGFIEQKNVRGNSYSADSLRFATIVFRVPSQQFDAIIDNMGTVGVVTSISTSGTDITDQYIDYETRIRNLKAQEETLLEILSKAEKLEDVITLEARISEVRYEIETIENKLKNYDRLVQYSRITIDLAEVVETTQVTPVARTLGQRIGNAFFAAIDSFEEKLEIFVVWLVYNWILLSVIIAVAIALIIILKARKKRKKEAVPVVVEIEGQDNGISQDSGNGNKQG